MAVTSTFMEPSWHSVEDTMNGFFVPFSTWSDSPVSFDSSIFTLLPDRKMPSAGTVSPAAISTMSPTMMSSITTNCIAPLRSTLMLRRLFTAFSARNCLSFCRSFTAVTFTHTTTAMMMAAPSYQPSPQPSVLTPRKIEITAAMDSRISVRSCMPSHTSSQ